MEMKQVLNRRMALVAVLSVGLTVLLTSCIFYGKFQAQICEDLKIHAHILLSTQEFLSYVEQKYDPKIDHLRITVVDAGGGVEYDSNADIGHMDNHGERPEILQALSGGEGYQVRRSDTLDRNTYYYAERLEDGRVLRVAREAGSLWSFVKTVLPALAVLLTAMVAFGVALARLLVREMIRPVEQLSVNLDKREEKIQTYEELRPFMDEIHRQHQELKRSARLRQEFTANVSHELKTPLASISGYAELIETGMAGEEDARRFAGEIYKCAGRLLALINDILHLSRLDGGEERTSLEQVDMGGLAADCVEMLQMQAKKYGVCLEYLAGHLASGDRLPRGGERACLVKGDRGMLEELLYNLCDNAIRYNHPGGHVWVSVAGQEDTVTLRVEDDGIGIPEECQERIFERFYRVDKGRSRDTGGTGLGLAIVKHIVERHRARLALSSRLEEGTCVEIEFLVSADSEVQVLSEQSY